ncbi:MAG: hypothetical protein V4487_07150, partial [Chlamydiota bacterium]
LLFPFDACLMFCISMFLYQLGLGILLPVCQETATRGDPTLTSSLFSLLYFSKMLGASLAGVLYSIALPFWPGQTGFLPYFISLFSLFNLFAYLKINRLGLLNPAE